jgi:hypothetical protein
VHRSTEIVVIRSPRIAAEAAPSFDRMHARKKSAGRAS